MLLPSESRAFSQSGEEIKWTNPSEYILFSEKSVASEPPLIAQETLSLAANLMNGEVFSSILSSLDKSPSLPEGPVIKGGVSSTSATVIVNAVLAILFSWSVARILTW